MKSGIGLGVNLGMTKINHERPTMWSREVRAMA